MPDMWSAVAQLDGAMQERLAEVLEKRAAEPQQQAMRQDFLAGIPFPPQARVLEVGCGTGALTRRLAGWTNVATALGVDPAPSLLARARELAVGLANIGFEQADARALPYDADRFDVVVFDSTLCHVPEPERALAEAFRVLRRSGSLAVFDGDYASTTVALGDHDPLQACAEATMAHSVHDRWLARRLPALVRGAGFQPLRFRSHSFVETGGDGYMLTVVDRGVDILYGVGRLGPDAAAALRAEARRRVENGAFFGRIAYASITARKPDR